MRPYLIASLLALAPLLAAFTPSEDGLYAVFNTSKGSFTARLDYELVPMTVANFVGLAEGTIPRLNETTGAIVTGPFYDGLTFNFLEKNTWVFGGDPKGDGTGGPGYTIPDELHPFLTLIPKGTLAMYNNSPNQNGSEFFFTLSENALPGADGYFSVFGLVVDGAATLDAINAVPTDPTTAKPTTTIEIHSVQIIREGVEAERFNVRDYPLPRLNPVPISFSNDGPSAQFPLAAGVKHLIATSRDLDTWTNETAAPATAEDRTINLSGVLDGPRFLSVGAREAPPISIDRNGYTFTASVLVQGKARTDWAHRLEKSRTTNEGGDVTIFGKDWVINEYEWFDQGPGKAHVDIITSNNYVIRYNLFFSDETSGNYYARVTDYALFGPNQQPVEYVSSGAFTLTKP